MSTEGYNKWSKIVNETVQKCSEKIPYVKTQNDICKNVPDYVHLITACVFTYNYLECPSMVNSEACQKTLDYVKNPDERYSFRIGNEKFVKHEFWYGF